MPNVTSMLQNAPLGTIVERLGTAIADAQFALDRKAIEIATMLGDAENHGVTIGSNTFSLLELGFAPTFYHVSEATVEARMAFSTSMTQEFKLGVSVGASIGVVSVQVDASYSAKYSFEASGSSAITAKFVSVPPPAIFFDRLREAFSATPTPTP